MDYLYINNIEVYKKGSKNRHKVQKEEQLIPMIMLGDNKMKVNKGGNVQKRTVDVDENYRRRRTEGGTN